MPCSLECRETIALTSCNMSDFVIMTAPTKTVVSHPLPSNPHHTSRPTPTRTHITCSIAALCLSPALLALAICLGLVSNPLASWTK